jgi:hypothetical protein
VQARRNDLAASQRFERGFQKLLSDRELPAQLRATALQREAARKRSRPSSACGRARRRAQTRGGFRHERFERAAARANAAIDSCASPRRVAAARFDTTLHRSDAHGGKCRAATG